jgi:hypothetical protein
MVGLKMSTIDGTALRSKQKARVLKLWSELIMEVELYFTVWYKFGGGTAGHAIGAVIAKLNEYRKFFASKC